MSQGVVLFHTTTSALRAEKILRKAGLVDIKLIPTPRELSSDCGVALRFEWDLHSQVKIRLASAGVDHEIYPITEGAV